MAVASAVAAPLVAIMAFTASDATSTIFAFMAFMASSAAAALFTFMAVIASAAAATLFTFMVFVTGAAAATSFVAGVTAATIFTFMAIIANSAAATLLSNSTRVVIAIEGQIGQRVIRIDGTVGSSGLLLKSVLVVNQTRAGQDAVIPHNIGAVASALWRCFKIRLFIAIKSCSVP